APLDGDNQYSKVYYVSETRQYFERFAYLQKYRSGNNEYDERIEDYNLLGYNIEEREQEDDRDVFNARSSVILPDMYPTVFFYTLDNHINPKYWHALPRHKPEEGTLDDSNSYYVRKREKTFELLMFDGSKQVATYFNNTYYTYPYLSSYGNNN